MKRSFVLIAFLSACFVASAQAQQSETNAEAVKRAVESYINKTNQNVLHPDAKIISVDGARKRLIESSFKPGKLKKGETIGESRQSIAGISVTEGGASVAVETDFTVGANSPAVTPSKHIQYISLLKINGEWKIVSILMPPLGFADAASK